MNQVRDTSKKLYLIIILKIMNLEYSIYLKIFCPWTRCSKIKNISKNNSKGTHQMFDLTVTFYLNFLKTHLEVLSQNFKQPIFELVPYVNFMHKRITGECFGQKIEIIISSNQ